MAKAPPMPMDDETDKLIDECEQSWETRTITIPNVTLDDAPLKELTIKAHNILAGESHESLDGLVCRLADAIPEGVTEANFETAKPLAKVCKGWFRQVENLRSGLKRPALDWGKAVDTAAKQWVARAEPTLLPIIDAVKVIEDRKKAEKAAAELAEVKRIEDERLAAEKANRDMLEAEQAAERSHVKAEQDAERAKLTAIADANRIEADRLASERKEMEELKRWLAEREAVVVPKAVSDEVMQDILAAPLGKIVALPANEDIALTVPEFVQVMEDFQRTESVPIHDPPNWPPPSAKLTNDELQSIMFDAETSAEYSKAGFQIDASADQQKVRDFGMAIKSFVDSLKRPTLVKHEARQAVELAVFDVYGIANGLQEWRGA